MVKVVDMPNKQNTKKSDMKTGLQVIGTVAIAAGLYGFKLGKAYGYSKGSRDGYQAASEEFISVMKGLNAELRAMNIKGDK